MAETLIAIKPFALAILGGVLPSLIWLWFWLQEDNKNPEPKGLLFITFCAGMAVVYLVLPVQKFIVFAMPQFSKTTLIALLAATEEIAKYIAVFFIAWRSRYFDEPIDGVVYMVTAALGFAAMENILYVLKDLTHGGTVLAILDGSSRFVGATILHTVSSSIIGIAIAFSFWSGRTVRFIAVVLSLGAAILLHAYFNLTIMDIKGTLNVLLAFTPYWGAIVGMIVIFEIIKRLKKSTNQSRS